MRYFLDTEFVDDGKGPLTLLSLGLVADDGRELYLVSREWQDADLNPWVREHVLPHLGDGPRLSRSEMRAAVEAFLGTDPAPQCWGYFSAYDWFLFCRLWGEWSQMPVSISKCCMDLRQWAVQLGIGSAEFKAAVPQVGTAHNALEDARWNRALWTYLRDRALDAR